MSSRQERELAMRDDVILHLGRIVVAARNLVQTSTTDPQPFVTLECEINQLMRVPWAKQLIDDIAKKLKTTPSP